MPLIIGSATWPPSDPRKLSGSIPVEVETKGRPRHPSPCLLQGEGLTKEVAVGTIIQDTQQRNPESQPRWDRLERADLFEQYRELRTQGLSERQAAKELRRFPEKLLLC